MAQSGEHNAGRFLLVANDFGGSVPVLPVLADGRPGELTFVADEPTGGNHPRDFAFDPTGQFLCCGNQRVDNLTVFRVGRSTGWRAFAGHDTAVGNPSILVFVNLAEAG